MYLYVYVVCQSLIQCPRLSKAQRHTEKETEYRDIFAVFKILYSLFKRKVDIRVSILQHLLLKDRHDRSKACEVIVLCFANVHNLQFRPRHCDYWVDFRPKKWLPLRLQYVPISNYLPKKETIRKGNCFLSFLCWNEYWWQLCRQK